jgi:hypothetical protein
LSRHDFPRCGKVVVDDPRIPFLIEDDFLLVSSGMRSITHRLITLAVQFLIGERLVDVGFCRVAHPGRDASRSTPFDTVIAAFNIREFGGFGHAWKVACFNADPDGSVLTKQLGSQRRNGF